MKTAIVTNNIREFADGWRAMLPVDELFDVVVDSAHEGVRKPDPRIFRLALERLGGTAPEAAVFLDDFHGNVAAAERLGIRGILVEEDHGPPCSAPRVLPRAAAPVAAADRTVRLDVGRPVREDLCRRRPRRHARRERDDTTRDIITRRHPSLGDPEFWMASRADRERAFATLRR